MASSDRTPENGVDAGKYAHTVPNANASRIATELAVLLGGGNSLFDLHVEGEYALELEDTEHRFDVISKAS